jgi:lysophospholipase
MTDESRSARARPADAEFTNWVAPDGQVLRRMDWPRPPETPARGSLLFAGGRADFIEKYLEAYGHWRARGWNVTTFDWRGQGKSVGELAPENPDTFDPFVEDFAALIANWQSSAAGPFVAVGHSMGGHLLLRTIVEKAPRLDAAVLVAPMILPNSNPLPAWLAPDLADVMCRIGLRGQPLWKTPPSFNRPGSRRQAMLTGCRERYEDELYWFEQEPGFRLSAPSWGWMRAAYQSAASAFTPQRLGDVKLPILMLGTEIDRLVSPAAIRRVAESLPDADLAMFDDSAHEILREEDAIRSPALARIDAFLDEHAR